MGTILCKVKASSSASFVTFSGTPVPYYSSPQRTAEQASPGIDTEHVNFGNITFHFHHSNKLLGSSYPDIVSVHLTE
jgi:hypothetical protein